MTIHNRGAEPWSPQNYDKRFRGDVTVREALTKSLNVPTVYLAERVGIPSIAATAKRLGITSPISRVPSLALGASEVTPFEIAQVYTTLANNGIRKPIQAILALSDARKNEIIWAPRTVERAVSNPAATYVVTNMLQSVVESGTGRIVRRLGYKGPLAGKTGTTSDNRDSWFAGYTPRLATVVWLGFDSGQATGLTGSSGAAPIFTQYMQCVEAYEDELDFVPPPGVRFAKIDLASGLLATSRCPDADVVTEVFLNEQSPVTSCPLHDDPGRYERSFKEETRGRAPLPREPERRPESFWDRLWN